MQAIQFTTKINGAILKIPAIFKNIVNRNATVIVLYDEDKKETKQSNVKKNIEQFFSICGIWENREITKEGFYKLDFLRRTIF